MTCPHPERLMVADMFDENKEPVTRNNCVLFPSASKARHPEIIVCFDLDMRKMHLHLE